MHAWAVPFLAIATVAALSHPAGALHDPACVLTDPSFPWQPCLLWIALEQAMEQVTAFEVGGPALAQAGLVRLTVQTSAGSQIVTVPSVGPGSPCDPWNQLGSVACEHIDRPFPLQAVQGAPPQFCLYRAGYFASLDGNDANAEYGSESGLMIENGAC